MKKQCADTLAAKLSEYESALRDIASSRARVGGHAMCRAIAEGVLKGHETTVNNTITEDKKGCE